MKRMLRQSIALGAAFFVAATGCRSEPVDTQELLTAQSLGLSDLQKGQLPQAELQFKRVVALAPSDPLGYVNLSLTYLRGGRYADAEDQLRRARRLNPASPEVGLIAAKLYSLTGRSAEARQTLEELRGDAKVLYALAELDAENPDSAAVRRYEQRLNGILVTAPANLAVRLKLVDLFVRRGQADSAVGHLEEVRRLRPEPPKEAQPHLDTTMQRLRAGTLSEARVSLDRFLHLMELTSPYQASLEEVKWVEGPLVGRPVLTFNPSTLIQTRGLIRVGSAAEVRFTDVTSDAGLPVPSRAATALAIGDYDGDGTDDVLASVASSDQGRPVAHLYRSQRGYFVDVTERAGVPTLLPAGAIFATFADFDNDGWLDLFAIGADSHGYLLRNTGKGTFEDVTAQARVADVGGARAATFADLDHDGDLDLLVVGYGGMLNRVYRNNIDGTFTAAWLSGASDTREVAIGDFDDDGRIDLFATRENGAGMFYRNAGLHRFEDMTTKSGLGANLGGAAAVGDFNNDGLLDIFVVSETRPELWRSDGKGAFTSDRAAVASAQSASRLEPRSAEILDYDNDGWLDVIVTGRRGVALLHNDGRGKLEDRTALLPATLRAARRLESALIAVSDVDNDGDQDIFLADSAGIHLLRNDGGNAKLAMDLRLMGLRTGSGKNNNFGIGAKIEVRAGEIYQTRVVTGRVTHFGLGPHLKADVVRVEWTNGVPQTIYFPGTDQDILELEQLKGSCAFLYTWDGTGFRFVTDVMWRSALGMPVGIMGDGSGGDGGGAAAYAPAGASQEYLRIPGDALQRRNDRYVLQFTEELWETAYLDEIQLLAVDHPDSVEVFVDERFVPPGPVQLRLFQAVGRRPPVSAVDDRGVDLLPALRESDGVYVSNLTPSRYQGIVEPHDLILDLGEKAGQPGTFLFLRGWIYPTDASINVALSQQASVKSTMPSLEVRNTRGQWETAVANIGFPSGKDKTVVINLAGKFPTRDHRVRIRTNMQIYWDQAFVGADASTNVLRTTQLQPAAANLHFRGYSRMYRRGGRSGPHWFAYSDVTQESPWRTIGGALTRYGEVLPLLKSADDMYVIMAPGDETTLEFDATSAGNPPPGWKRTFLLYTDGWIKDADLNTANGNSVEPLPFHSIKEYPYAPGESYPTDSAHVLYRQQYNTRVIGRR